MYFRVNLFFKNSSIISRWEIIIVLYTRHTLGALRVNLQLVDPSINTGDNIDSENFDMSTRVIQLNI